MESKNSASSESQATVDTANPTEKVLSDKWFSESFESLIPKIQEHWPDLAKQTLEATRGSLDEVIQVISEHSGKTTYGVQAQLEELFNSASEKTRDLAENFEPLEKQLEELLDDLNKRLRPQIEKPIKERPLLAIGLAASIGVILGLMLSGGKNPNE